MKNKTIVLISNSMSKRQGVSTENFVSIAEKTGNVPEFKFDKF